MVFVKMFGELSGSGGLLRVLHELLHPQRETLCSQRDGVQTGPGPTGFALWPLRVASWPPLGVLPQALLVPPVWAVPPVTSTPIFSSLALDPSCTDDPTSHQSLPLLTDSKWPGQTLSSHFGLGDLDEQGSSSLRVGNITAMSHIV